jgi:hypothetical protein
LAEKLTREGLAMLQNEGVKSTFHEGFDPIAASEDVIIKYSIMFIDKVLSCPRD